MAQTLPVIAATQMLQVQELAVTKVLQKQEKRMRLEEHRPEWSPRGKRGKKTVRKEQCFNNSTITNRLTLFKSADILDTKEDDFSMKTQAKRMSEALLRIW